MIGLTLLAMIITHYLPKFTKAIPSALTAIIVVTLITLFIPLDGVHILNVSDMIGGSKDAIQHTFSIPYIPFNLNSLSIIVPYAFILATIGISESLMTVSLIDERTKTLGSGNKECIEQGVGNIVSGFFKSMGGCAMIGQSMINISSGVRVRLSGIFAAIFLLSLILFAMPIIRLIPLAALVGVMFIHDALIIIVVTITTVATDLAIAVIVGVILASLVFALQTGKNIYTESSIHKNGTKKYILHGPLFFGSSTRFKTLFTPEQDPQETITSFKYSRIADHSAIDAIQYITNIYSNLGKNLHLKYLNNDCQKLLKKADNIVEVNTLKDTD